VDDQERFGGRKRAPSRGVGSRRDAVCEARLLRDDAPAELHEEHRDSGDASRRT